MDISMHLTPGLSISCLFHRKGPVVPSYMMFGMAIGFAGRQPLPGLGGATTLALDVAVHLQHGTGQRRSPSSSAPTPSPPRPATLHPFSSEFRAKAYARSATIVDGHPMAKNGEAAGALAQRS